MMGVVIAQLMRLNTTDSPDPVFGYHTVAIPLSCACHLSAMMVVIVGASRFLHWQDQIAQGYAISSGWELLLIIGLSLAVSSCKVPFQPSSRLTRSRFFLLYS